MRAPFQLGPWTVDPRLGELSRPDRPPVRVRARVMDLLVCFAERPGEVLTKDDLLNGVWQSEAISESALTRTIAELRQALGDDAERPAFLETIPKRGYRLIATVNPSLPAQHPPEVHGDRTVTGRGGYRGAVAAVAVLTATLIAGVASRTALRNPVSTLAFQPHDLVLVTRFENRTGESVFDGAVEQALYRELSASPTLGLASPDRVTDALRMMGRPLDTVVDATLGRELCLRDTAIKALLTGSIERVRRGYEITATLVDPRNGLMVSGVVDTAVSVDGVLPVLRSHARRVRQLLGENLTRIAPAPAPSEPASTASLRSYQLYDESYRLGRRGQWEGARALAQQAVETDAEFASGWIWLARALRHSGASKSEVHAAATEGLSRAHQVPEWERHWIVGSHATLTGDYPSAVRAYEALLAMRPDHYFGAVDLYDAYVAVGRPELALATRRRLSDMHPDNLHLAYLAAMSSVQFSNDFTTAEPYIARVRNGLSDDRWRALASDTTDAEMTRLLITGWLDALPAYQLWLKGDVVAAGKIVDAMVRSIPSQPGWRWDHYINLTGGFYLVLGRLREAETLYHRLIVPATQLSVLADLRDDTVALRFWLDKLSGTNAIRPHRLVKAGLIDRARNFLEAERVDGPVMHAYHTFGRGVLAVRDGRLHDAIPLLRESQAVMRHSWMAAYYEACQSLASALDTLGDRGGAVRELELCISKAPPYNGVFSGAYWLEANAQLAELYRLVGRQTEAEQLDEMIRSRLVLADRDHPLLVRLNRDARRATAVRADPR